ncbi:MAG: hypothetical protein RLZZ78_1328, partial [Armatimonadota bacterium]
MSFIAVIKCGSWCFARSVPGSKSFNV